MHPYTIPTLKTSVRTNFRPGFSTSGEATSAKTWPKMSSYTSFECGKRIPIEKLCAKPLLKFCVEIHFSRYQNSMWKNSTIFQSSMENVYGKNE